MSVECDIFVGKWTMQDGKRVARTLMVLFSVMVPEVMEQGFVLPCFEGCGVRLSCQYSLVVRGSLFEEVKLCSFLWKSQSWCTCPTASTGPSLPVSSRIGSVLGPMHLDLHCAKLVAKNRQITNPKHKKRVKKFALTSRSFR